MGTFSRRILTRMALVSLLPLVVMSFLGYLVGVPALERAAGENLNAALEARATCINRYLSSIRLDLLTASLCQCAVGACGGGREARTGDEPICNLLSSLTVKSKSYRQLAIYKPDWSLLVRSTDSREEIAPTPAMREMARTRVPAISPISVLPGGTVVFQAGQPSLDPDGRIRSFAVATVDVVTALPGLREGSARLSLVTGAGDWVLPPEGYPFTRPEPSGLPAELLRASGTAVHYRDWRGVPVLGVAVKLPEMDWVLVAELEKARAFSLIREQALKAGLSGLLAAAVVFLASYRSALLLSGPLRELAKVARGVSAGMTRQRAPVFADTEIRDVGEAFNSMLNRIEVHQQQMVNAASLAAVGELSSSLVHQMRNPITSIRMSLKALEEQVQGDPAHRELAEIALRQSRRLETMLAELLKFGKPIELSRVKTDVGDLLAEVTGILRECATVKNIRFEIRDHLDGQSIAVDREQFERALANLGENAIQWSPHGGVVTLDAAFGTEAGDREVVLTVSDHGSGIPEVILSKLFRPFFTTREDGTGLGLAYVKKIAECHGGRVSAGNRPGAGAFFSVFLPCGESDGEQDTDRR